VASANPIKVSEDPTIPWLLQIAGLSFRVLFAIPAIPTHHPRSMRRKRAQASLSRARARVLAQVPTATSPQKRAPIWELFDAKKTLSALAALAKVTEQEQQVLNVHYSICADVLVKGSRLAKDSQEREKVTDVDGAVACLNTGQKSKAHER
jgi:hypothetical protein